MDPAGLCPDPGCPAPSQVSPPAIGAGSTAATQGMLSSHVPSTQAHLELSLGRPRDDDHPLAGVGTFCRGDLRNGGGAGA